MQTDQRTDFLQELDTGLGNGVFNVVIAYDDLPAGHRAMKLFSSLVDEFGEEFKLKAQPWRFDLLAHPECRDFALADASNAVLLIVSTSSNDDLPPAVRDWVGECVKRRIESEGAIVALIGKEGRLEKANSPRLRFLREAAEKAEMDFFAPWESTSDPLQPHLGNIHTRAETVTRTLEQILYPREARRDWGINE